MTHRSWAPWVKNRKRVTKDPYANMPPKVQQAWDVLMPNTQAQIRIWGFLL